MISILEFKPLTIDSGEEITFYDIVIDGISLHDQILKESGGLSLGSMFNSAVSSDLIRGYADSLLNDSNEDSQRVPIYFCPICYDDIEEEVFAVDISFEKDRVLWTKLNWEDLDLPDFVSFKELSFSRDQYELAIKEVMKKLGVS